MTMANVNLDGLAKFPYTVRPSSIYVAISVAISSDDLRGGRGGTRGDAGERRSLTIFARGTSFPLTKPKDGERRLP